MPATSPLRQARITVILLLVTITLLLLKNNLIPLHQSSNFVWSPSNHLGSGTIFFGITACMFSLIATTSAGAVDILFVFVCLYLLEASFVICKDSSHSNNILILFVLLKLILVSLCSFYYMCFVPNR